MEQHRVDQREHRGDVEAARSYRLWARPSQRRRGSQAITVGVSRAITVRVARPSPSGVVVGGLTVQPYRDQDRTARYHRNDARAIGIRAASASRRRWAQYPVKNSSHGRCGRARYLWLGTLPGDRSRKRYRRPRAWAVAGVLRQKASWAVNHPAAIPAAVGTHPQRDVGG
mgnify:CR=1 FL=1